MPVLKWAIGNRRIVLAGAAVLVLMTIAFARLLGLEFLPKLEEGNLWIRATLPPTISLQEGNAYVNEMRRMIRARPEVESVVSQHGRPDDGTDPVGFFNVDIFAPLKPFTQWPRGLTKDQLIAPLLWRAAVKEKHRRAQPLNQHLLQQIAHLAILREDQRGFARFDVLDRWQLACPAPSRRLDSH